jgi:hypothetical protein
MIMDYSIGTSIRRALPKSPTSAMTFLATIEGHFQCPLKLTLACL